MRQYTTITEIENYLLTNIIPDFRPQVDTWITQMSKYIENYTGRTFIEIEEERVFDGNDVQIINELMVDDFTELISLKIGDKEIDLEKVLVYPSNSEKKDRIILVQDYFWKGRQNIKVNAKWGYSKEIPADIVYAATILVAGIINFSHNAHGEISSETVGQYSVSYNSEPEWNDFRRAMKSLDNYKRLSL